MAGFIHGEESNKFENGLGSYGYLPLNLCLSSFLLVTHDSKTVSQQLLKINNNKHILHNNTSIIQLVCDFSQPRKLV